MTRAADWYPWLRYAVLFISLVAAVAIVGPAEPDQPARRRGCRLGRAARARERVGGVRGRHRGHPACWFDSVGGPDLEYGDGRQRGWRGGSPFSQQGNGNDPQSGQGEFAGGSGPGARARPTQNSRRFSRPPPPAGPRQPSATKVRPASNWPVVARPSWLLVAGVDPIRRRHSRNSRPTSPLERSVTSLSAERAAARWRRRNQQRDHQLGDVKLHSHLRRRSDGL